MSTALKNKKVRVMPITRSGGWLKPEHDGGFMYTGTKATYCVPINPNNGRLIDPLKDLTAEEKKDLADRLAISLEDLNINKVGDDNFWAGREVKLDKMETILDLSDPNDFINYAILKANSQFIAPSYDQRLGLGTYRFALVDEEDRAAAKRKTTDDKKEAYKELGKLEVSETKLRNFFKVYGKKVPADATKDWLIAEIDLVIEDDLKGFLAIVKDTHFDNKILLAEAVAVKALVKKGNNTYELPGGLNIGVAEKAIDWLYNPEHSEEFLVIKERIKAAK